MSNQPPGRRGSLYLRLVIPLSAFVLLACLGLAIWMSSLHRRESMRRFQQTAVSNAGFMGQVPLPRSSEMARRLSAILEVRVAFLRADGTIVRSSEDGWPRDLGTVLKEVAGSETTATRIGDHDLAITPLIGSQDHLILVRGKEGGLTGLGGWVLAPTLFLTAAFGCLVFLLAHRIVRPLTVLTRWLPNLKHDEEPAEPIPSALSARSDELGQLARSLQETHQSLLREQKLRHQSERLATLGRIATSLAHEIRNPAAAIRMHADLIEPGVEAGRSESISLIREEVERITDLVNQWLFVARAAPPERRPHDLGEMLTAVARRQKPALRHAGSHLKLAAGNPALIA
ncbi:MAG: histidine kinase dimerization/phospho-acceptor domain-containing protein, partial [Verrucomicrobiota bacterium]|nr:histidine kinase dimerization/phospho-acceptor domain-containing protein [Verrucomicrobiota bacterium]